MSTTEDQTRNPHAGQPFTDDDETVRRALEDVSVPALLCSMVHMTGDPAWVRSDLRPSIAMINTYDGGMSEEDQARAREWALPAILDFRDGGCVLPPPPSPEVLREMMTFLGVTPVDEKVVPLFEEDLHLDGADSGAIEWGPEVPADALAAAHTVVIGCGEAGLLTGIRLAQAGVPFTIVEKSDGPGGTWWDNRYPGARVDIGSHFYCYSFEPSDHWTEYFAQQPELKEYFARVMDDYDVRPHVRFGTEVTEARWDDTTHRWTVTVRTRDGATDTLDARFVVSAVGSLNMPAMPDIPGTDDFAGPSVHSARWDPDVDWKGSRFGLVGAGASGFQIAPTIADDVEQLTIFQRTAQWMFPNPHYHEAVPPGDKWAMRHLPFYGRWFRFLTFYPAAGLSMDRNRIDPEWDDGGRSISASSAETRKLFTAWIESQLQDRPDLLEVCIPHYPPSAKRMLQDNGSWLTCLKKPNVELVRTGIDRVVPEGIVTSDGRLHELDVICYATGFRHNDFLWPMHVTGRDGTVLREQWGHEPAAYLGITVPNFPNLFCIYGPGTNLAHGASLIFQSECQVNYILSCLHEVLAGGHEAMEPRQEVHDEYMDLYQSEISQMVWSHWAVKHSHFKNPDGKVFTLSPWPIPTYWDWTRAVEPDDYVFT